MGPGVDVDSKRNCWGIDIGPDPLVRDFQFPSFFFGVLEISMGQNNMLRFLKGPPIKSLIYGNVLRRPISLKFCTGTSQPVHTSRERDMSLSIERIA